jgi:hypothetical protein
LALVLVTGISGSGKSAVCVELQQRGHEAHDMDLEGNAAWVHRRSGTPVPLSDVADPSVRSAAWLEEHDWKLVPSRVEGLARQAGDRTVFLCGMASNQDDLSHLFSHVICLSVDEHTLRDRVATRTSNDFGKTSHELAAVLGWRDVVQEAYRQGGATMIDATLPLTTVVDAVLAASS